MPGGCPGRYLAAGLRRQIELTDRAIASVDLASRQARIVLLTDDDRWITFGCLTPLLTEMLHSRGWHVVHAACLRLGREPGGPVVLLCGSSGMGKTTTALALSRGQMRLLADDAVFARIDSNGAWVWGLGRPCKVHPHTRLLLGWLAELPSEPAVNAEEGVMAFSLLGDPTPRVAHPAVVLVLEPRNAVAHHLRPLHKNEALVHLVRENVRWLKGSAAFAAMAGIVRACGCYGLSVGPDLNVLHQAILSLPELNHALAHQSMAGGLV
jgi:hypothetical protein